MTCAGRSRSRSLALPVSARTRRTSSIGNVLAITPRLMRSPRRTPAGRPAGTRAIAVAHPRASASMAQPHLYVNGIGSNPRRLGGNGRRDWAQDERATGDERMARYRTCTIEFKRQLVEEQPGGVGLIELARRHG